MSMLKNGLIMLTAFTMGCSSPGVEKTQKDISDSIEKNIKREERLKVIGTYIEDENSAESDYTQTIEYDSVNGIKTYVLTGTYVKDTLFTNITQTDIDGEYKEEGYPEKK